MNAFDQLVASSAEEALSKMLGNEVWRAVTFYFDIEKLASEPDTFTKIMSKLFGASSKVLQTIIVEKIIAKIGSNVEPKKDREFKDWIQVARAKFISASLTIQK